MLSVAFATVPFVTSAAEYAEFARALLPQPFADRWIELLRPAVIFSEHATAPEHAGLHRSGDPLEH